VDFLFDGDIEEDNRAAAEEIVVVVVVGRIGDAKEVVGIGLFNVVDEDLEIRVGVDGIDEKDDCRDEANDDEELVLIAALGRMGDVMGEDVFLMVLKIG
jgi:hypothetical protein